MHDPARSMPYCKEIDITTLDDVFVGNMEDIHAATGVTVLVFPHAARVGVDISGGGPASRESAVLSPLAAPTPVNAIVLSGGSAYGLAASDGVMEWLEVRGMGFDTGIAPVPIVVQSCLYDLGYGDPDVRPDAAMGMAACEAALARAPFVSGSYGAGAGATVGKICGMRRAMKGGLGVYAVTLGKLIMAAVVVVNALGDVYDERSGQKIAGLLTEDRSAFADSRAAWYAISAPTNLFTQTNTTIGAVLTNGDLDRAQLTKLACMTRNAYARCIRPAGTLADGDTIYAASFGREPVDCSMAGVLAAEVMAEAIRRAVTTSQVDDATFLAHCWSSDRVAS